MEEAHKGQVGQKVQLKTEVAHEGQSGQEVQINLPALSVLPALCALKLLFVRQIYNSSNAALTIVNLKFGIDI